MRHKHKNPRVNVYFKYKGNCFKLLEAINFGSKSAPELKIKELSETYMQIKDDQHRFDGQFHVGQLIRFVDGNHLEFTYHKDGSILTEVIQPSGEKEYSNPYGTGERWTPIADVTTYQPVMIMQLLSSSSYRRAFIEEKYGLKNYIVKNDRLFEFQKGQGVLVLIYLKHKEYPLAKYCFDDKIYSDVLMKFGENWELCILIQKQMHPDNAGAMIKSSYSFVDRLDGYDYLNDVLCTHIFDPTFAKFMKIVQTGDCYFNISEKMMQVIESVDPLYQSPLKENLPVYVQKPEVIRRLLDNLGGEYDEYLSMSKEKQVGFVLEQCFEPLDNRNKEINETRHYIVSIGRSRPKRVKYKN